MHNRRVEGAREGRKELALAFAAGSQYLESGNSGQYAKKLGYQDSVGPSREVGFIIWFQFVIMIFLNRNPVIVSRS